MPLIADCPVEKRDNNAFGSLVGHHKSMGRGDEGHKGAMTVPAAHDLNMRVDFMLVEEFHNVVFHWAERRNAGFRIAEIDAEEVQSDVTTRVSWLAHFTTLECCGNVQIMTAHNGLNLWIEWSDFLF